MIDPRFWSGIDVFITGHTGFKGSWLCLWLKSMGSRVTGYALDPPTSPSLYEAAEVGSEIDRDIRGDIRDLPRLRDAIEEARPNIIFHLAAQPLVQQSYEDPVETYSTNVMGTVHLMEASRDASKLQALVAVSSDKCYENNEWPWGYREIDPMGGHDPYSSSKGCAELAVSAFRRSFFSGEQPPHLASARAGNVVGGGDWAADRLLPDIVRAFSEGEPVHVRNPHAVRPWQHVLDALSGYLTLAQRLVEEGPRFAGGWNFGPATDSGHSVSWVVSRAKEMWGEGAEWTFDETATPHEAHYLKLDCSKARSLLKWKARLSTEEALAWAVEWYRAFYGGKYDDSKSVMAFTLDRIERFQSNSDDFYAYTA
jgi:CDP-glucose 4,6-dehydratase